MGYRMRILFLIIFLSITAFCNASPKHVQEAERIIRIYTKQMKKDRALYAIGTGGAMMYDVQEITLHFVSYAKLDVAQAREVFVDCCEGLITTVNADEKIRPFLRDYPFTIKNADIMISFQKKSGGHVDSEYVAFVCCSKNFIHYAYHDNDKDMLTRITKEPYEEALRIVKEQRGER